MMLIYISRLRRTVMGGRVTIDSERQFIFEFSKHDQKTGETRCVAKCRRDRNCQRPLLTYLLLLTVIGGYSDSDSGIPSFASNSPPPLRIHAFRVLLCPASYRFFFSLVFYPVTVTAVCHAKMWRNLFLTEKHVLTNLKSIERILIDATLYSRTTK